MWDSEHEAFPYPLKSHGGLVVVLCRRMSRIHQRGIASGHSPHCARPDVIRRAFSSPGCWSAREAATRQLCVYNITSV